VNTRNSSVSFAKREELDVIQPHKRYNKTLVSITKEKNVLDEVVKNNNLVLGDCE